MWGLIFLQVVASTDVPSQAADYVVEFLRKFYLIFPEFENMDVCALESACLYAESITDLLGGRIVRWSIYTLHGRRDTQNH